MHLILTADNHPLVLLLSKVLSGARGGRGGRCYLRSPFPGPVLGAGTPWSFHEDVPLSGPGTGVSPQTGPEQAPPPAPEQEHTRVPHPRQAQDRFTPSLDRTKQGYTPPTPPIRTRHGHNTVPSFGHTGGLT